MVHQNKTKPLALLAFVLHFRAAAVAHDGQARQTDKLFKVSPVHHMKGLANQYRIIPQGFVNKSCRCNYEGRRPLLVRLPKSTFVPHMLSIRSRRCATPKPPPRLIQTVCKASTFHGYYQGFTVANWSRYT
jgi:hypothetical protein